RLPPGPLPAREPPALKRGGGGGIRTRGPLARTLVFKTSAFDHSATPPRSGLRVWLMHGAMHHVRVREAVRAWSFTLSDALGRGGRVAEGTRLLSEYGEKSLSRVRIPPSPFLLQTPVGGSG